jgi:hypothetical protein
VRRSLHIPVTCGILRPWPAPAPRYSVEAWTTNQPGRSWPRWNAKACDTPSLGDAFRFDDLDIVRMPFEDLTVSVASPATLYRMKRNTVRLKDRADAEMLKRRFNLNEDR